jgi:transposase InsO family protein
MRDGEKLGLEQIRALVSASAEVAFEGQQRKEVYGWVERVLREQQYRQQGRAARGLLRQYVVQMTGLSRAQATRLIGRYLEQGTVAETRYRRHRFTQRYTRADVELLAAVDEAHETLSGPATRHILTREYNEFGQAEYERLATISVAHIYRLRKRATYRQRRLHFTKTNPTPVAIGERRRPESHGRPGYLRVDTVHQGDRDGVKGVYHINAVDEVTQWQVVGCTPAISEAWLAPLLTSMLKQFPFVIHGFHSDNGSEFVNHTVAKLLSKLLIEQTKSRPRHSNDNGLVEAKNGAVIRKHMGYGHIAAPPCGTDSRLLRTALQCLFESPPALRASGCGDRCERETTALLQALSNAAGNIAGFVQSGAVSATGCHAALLANKSAAEERHTSGARNATGQTGALRGNAAERLRPWK